MANQPLIRVWFPLFRKTDGDAGRVKDDPYGVFSCRQSTQRFLDIPDSAVFTGDIYKTAKGGSRVFTLADGTVLSQSTENTDAKSADYQYVVRKRVGQRNVVIKTGKRIYPSDPKKTQTYTISFAFPTWADINTISDALGEIIPEGKIDKTPGNTEIYPYFTIKNGGSYGITSKSVATADTSAGTGQAQIEQLVQAQGGKVKKGAG